MWDAVIIVILIALFICIYFKEKAEAKAEAEEEKRLEIWKTEQLERLSLTCGDCGGLAAPILQTLDRYKCPKCGKQFSGARHNF